MARPLFSTRFCTVGSNNAFYRLPERSTFAKWAAATPDDFTMAVKASRQLGATGGGPLAGLR